MLDLNSIISFLFTCVQYPIYWSFQLRNGETFSFLQILLSIEFERSVVSAVREFLCPVCLVNIGETIDEKIPDPRSPRNFLIRNKPLTFKYSFHSKQVSVPFVAEFPLSKEEIAGTGVFGFVAHPSFFETFHSIKLSGSRWRFWKVSG